MKWLKSLFGGKTAASESYGPRRVTHTNPLTIQNPKIGFLNLIGTAGRPLINADATALKPLFSACLESDGDIPACDVLMVYARIEANGAIQNVSQNLREIIHKSNAPIVVVATENEGQSYIAASKRPGSGKANLVMTLKRNGQVFPNFFKELFAMMHRGITMPMAWVKLAPQTPGVEHRNVPETICAMEITHVRFESEANLA
ncbi:MAG TPA: hypothetical protein VFI60_08100 [Candidatus Acidoferrum sp.]|nr:hypothetical protein [Candidatus Acidoferrum sp.]